MRGSVGARSCQVRPGTRLELVPTARTEAPPHSGSLAQRAAGERVRASEGEGAHEAGDFVVHLRPARRLQRPLADRNVHEVPVAGAHEQLRLVRRRDGDRPPGRRRPGGERGERPSGDEARARWSHLEELPVADGGAEERLLLARKARDGGLVELVLHVHGEDARLGDEGHDEECVVRAGRVRLERPEALHAGEVHARLLVDPHAVADDPQAPVLVDPAAGHHLPLALPVQVHDAEIHNRPQAGEGLHNLEVGARVVRLRVQPHELRVPALAADVHDAGVEVGDRRRDGRLAEGVQLQVLDGAAVADEREEPQRAGDVAEEVSRAVGVDGAVAADHGRAAGDRALDVHCGIAEGGESDQPGLPGRRDRS